MLYIFIFFTLIVCIFSFYNIKSTIKRVKLLQMVSINNGNKNEVNFSDNFGDITSINSLAGSLESFLSKSTLELTEEGVKHIEHDGLFPSVTVLKSTNRKLTNINGLLSESNDKIVSITKAGLFLDFNFKNQKAQHDIQLGKFASGTRLLCYNRIKRWWQAPTLCTKTDDIPVETQMILAELNRGTHTEYKNEDNTFSRKMYAVILPLIDYNSGFRVTLFGKEGGSLAGNDILCARAESGDPDVVTMNVKDALYIATGSDPYELVERSFRAVSQRMGSFRTRSQKALPDYLDKFGFCTWDAFYSSVNGDKVKTAVKSLSNAGVPPKFLIIDDGWQSTGNRHDEDSSRISGSDSSSSTIDEVDNSNVEITEIQAKEKIEPLSTVDSNKPSSSSSSGSSAATVTKDDDDGDLSGAQIDGSSLISDDGSNPLLQWGTNLIANWYSEYVEPARPDAVSVKVWTMLSQTVFRDILTDFFATRTDFTKRLISVRANHKFEDSNTNRTLKSLVSELKQDMGLDRVFVWHALLGYWGGVSERRDDDIHDTSVIAKSMNSQFNMSVDLSTNSNSILVQRRHPTPTPHLLWVEPALAWDPSSMTGSGAVEPNRLQNLYHQMHSYLSAAGVDGVKVDAQSGVGAFGRGLGGGPAVVQACVKAVETSVKQAFQPSVSVPILSSVDKTSEVANPSSLPDDEMNKVLPTKSSLTITPPISQPLSLVGCMCHSTENLYNFYDTTIVRASDDFYPKDKAAQSVHIVSCAFNSLMLGEIGIPDWDMFHSRHECASFHAAARAISGGPIYVSDPPGSHDANLLRQLVIPESGRVLRPVLPARPTADCLFKDVMSDGVSALKVWSRNPSGSGVVGVFNTQGAKWDRRLRKYVENDSPRPTVEAYIRPLDIPEFVPKESNLAEELLMQSSIASPSISNTNGRNILDMPIRVFRRALGLLLLLIKNEWCELKELISQVVNGIRAILQRKRIAAVVWLTSILKHIRVLNKNSDDMIESKATGETQSHNEIECENKRKRSPSFVAWSSKQKSLHLLDSGVSGISISVSPLDWDMFSVSLVREMSTAFSKTNIPVYDADGKKANYGKIYWAPIGLLDMMNAGGAIADVSTISSYLISRISFLYYKFLYSLIQTKQVVIRTLIDRNNVSDNHHQHPHGVVASFNLVPGLESSGLRCGVYASERPLSIHVSGERVPFDYVVDTIEAKDGKDNQEENHNNGLVSFQIPVYQFKDEDEWYPGRSSEEAARKEGKLSSHGYTFKSKSHARQTIGQSRELKVVVRW